MFAGLLTSKISGGTKVPVTSHIHECTRYTCAHRVLRLIKNKECRQKFIISFTHTLFVYTFIYNVYDTNNTSTLLKKRPVDTCTVSCHQFVNHSSPCWCHSRRLWGLIQKTPSTQRIMYTTKTTTHAKNTHHQRLQTETSPMSPI